MSTEILRIGAEQLATEYGACENLGQVVSAIEQSVKSQGRVVCAITVNGLRLSEADEARLALTALHDLQMVELETEEPINLVESTLTSQIHLAGELERVALLNAEAFRRLDLQPAQTMLVNLLDGCRWFTDGLVAIKAAPPELFSRPLDQNQWHLSEVEFRRVIGEILAAVDRRDFNLIADLLEYDLGNSLERWRALLSPR